MSRILIWKQNNIPYKYLGKIEIPTNHAANIGAYLQTITLGMQVNDIYKSRRENVYFNYNYTDILFYYLISFEQNWSYIEYIEILDIQIFTNSPLILQIARISNSLFSIFIIHWKIRSGTKLHNGLKIYEKLSYDGSWYCNKMIYK